MMLGGAGTGSACHQDRKGTPFWLAMLHGRKKVVMYSRADAQLLYPFGTLDQGAFSSFRFDPFDPDYKEFRASPPIPPLTIPCPAQNFHKQNPVIIMIIQEQNTACVYAQILTGICL